MQKVIISPSKLEEFRLHLTDGFNGTITVDKVIDKIKGVSKWAPRMVLGTAVHAILEYGPGRYRKEGKIIVQEDGMPESVTFTDAEIQPLIKHRSKHPYMVHEIKAKHTLSITTEQDSYEVILNMRIDGMEGIAVHEHKTSDKPAEIENYIDSCQWKIYLLTAGVPIAIYNTFQIKQPKGKPIEIIPFTFDFHAYRDMPNEITTLLRQFIEFCEHRGLIEYITAKY